MIYRKIGNVETSAIGLGTWAIGGGEWWGDSDQEQSIETLKLAIDQGINLIDTAPVYGFGNSERVVGEAIKGIRDKVILSTKCGLWWNDERGSEFFKQGEYTVRRCLDPDTIKKEVEISLERLQTDYIDVYFTHWQTMDPYFTPVEETMKCLMDLKSQGIIKAIGASNVSKDDILEYKKFGELDVIQEKYSMLDRGIEETLIPSCNQTAVMAYSPLEQGLLTGKIGMDYVVDDKEYRAGIEWYQLDKRRKVLDMLEKIDVIAKKHNCTLSQLVISWTMHQKGISHVLCGARKPHHIMDTVQAANVQLTKEEMSLIREYVVNITSC